MLILSKYTLKRNSIVLNLKENKLVINYEEYKEIQKDRYLIKANTILSRLNTNYNNYDKFIINRYILKEVLKTIYKLQRVDTFKFCYYNLLYLKL